ncbi:hypothetical protein QEN19_003464 [Hanseniaspora menglaensis]
MLFERHDGENHSSDSYNSHYANIDYGSLVFKAMLVYIVVFLALKRLYHYRNYNGDALERQWRFGVKTKKIIDAFINLNPLLHLILVISISLVFHFIDLHITKMTVYFKRVARLSYVLTFTNLFLVIPRSNYFIFMSYLDSIRFHVWLSIFILFLSTLHSVLFMIKWLLDGVFLTKIFKPQNFIGLIIFSITLALLIVGLTDYRRKNYTNFFLIHQLGMFCFVVLTIIHANPQILTPFGIFNTGFLIVMIVNKYINNLNFDGEDPFIVTDIKKFGDLKVVKFSNKKLNSLNTEYSSEDNMHVNLVPGSHIRVHDSGFFDWKYWFKPSHPYTLVSNNELIIKEYEFSNFNSSLVVDKSLSLVGLYEPNESIKCMLNTSQRKRVSLVVGGSGISFALPILKRLLLLNEKKSANKDLISFYWSIKRFQDAHVIVAFLKSLIKYETLGTPQFFLKLNVTRNGDEIQEEQKDALISALNEYKGSLEFDIEYDLRFHVSSLSAEGDFVSTSTDFKEWIVCCGPSDLIENCKQFVDASNFKIAESFNSNSSCVEFINELYEF